MAYGLVTGFLPSDLIFHIRSLGRRGLLNVPRFMVWFRRSLSRPQNGLWWRSIKLLRPSHPPLSSPAPSPNSTSVNHTGYNSDTTEPISDSDSTTSTPHSDDSYNSASDVPPNTPDPL
jgi:hypothetical protein